MTTNFGCCERRTMASQPSDYNEERNLLRLRAWEQRNQETSQAKEQENVPLFGEPYKTNKGDELSSLIQRMLGSYEDVNHPTTMEPLRVPSYASFSQSNQGQTNPDSEARPPFHIQAISSQSHKAPTSHGFPSQSSRTSGAASSPDRHGSPSIFSKASLNHSQQCSGDLGNTGANAEEACDQHPRLPPSECPGSGDASAPLPRDSTKDPSLPQPNKGGALPSQTFPSLLSKQPSMVLTQKPTAYVRPLDGQDQVVNQSPELKPSPEPYGPLPELISKPHVDKDKETLPPYLEMRPNEAQCVEDILREMTCSWPPILTAINTPNTDEPSKSPSQPKGSEHVSSHPGQTVIPEKCDPPAVGSSQHFEPSSSRSFKAPHSRGPESPSSSDSESSSRSDSDGDSAAEEPPTCPGSSSTKAECTGPTAKHVDWQLGNWIRSSQQSCPAEGHCNTHAPQTPRPPPPSQSLTVEPGWEAKAQQESTQKAGKPLAYGERHQQSSKQPSSPTPPSPPPGLTGCSHEHSCTSNSSSSVKAGSVQTPPNVGCEKVDRDPRFTVRPKVKTKMAPSRKKKERKDKKRTCKHESQDERKAGSESEVALVLYAHCPSCGVQYPNSCSCPPHSPAQPDQPSPVPPVKVSCTNSKSHAVCQKGTKVPLKTVHKHLDKPPRSSRDPHRYPRSLLVKIDLGLLSKVPPVSRNHQESLCREKDASAAKAREGRSGGAAVAQKVGKSGKTSHNIKVDNKVVPRKKPRLDHQTPSSHASGKLKSSRGSMGGRQRKKKARKNLEQQQHSTAKKASKDRPAAAGFTETNKSSCKHKTKDSQKHKGGGGKPPERPPQSDKKPTEGSVASPPSPSPTSRAVAQQPLLRWEDRQFPVKHYIKEAKKLKHRADAEADKLLKAFSYVDAAMFFVESGVAMENDHHISTSSYTMFAETVELLKFVLKLKTSADASAPPSETDFVALCLRCQALLHMAMFRHKQKTAIKYSKTLTDHFSNTAQRTQSPLVSTPKVTGTPSPMPSLPSPAPCSNHGADPASSFVTVPQVIEQVAFSYVSITSLFLRAHEIWERAEELARKGSGLLTELDRVLGPLNLMSSMTFMVRYTRQGVHWLRLGCRRGS